MTGNERRGWQVTALLLVVVGCELLRTGWVSDDAYITFRSADNLVHGFGPVWNTTERVHGFTHPLWMGVFSVFYAITRDAYYTSIGLGAALTLLATLVVRRIASTTHAFVAAAGALVSSKAFVDFSTSGLENPLSHVLVAAFLWCWWKCEGEQRLSRLTLLASLCLLNRIDLAVLIGPAIAIECLRSNPLRSWKRILIGFSPLLIWELFSMWYYGSLVPNTAYAKLNITQTMNETLLRGWWYMARTATADPSTLPTMIAAAIAATVSSWRRDWPLVAGLMATVAYVFWIGGDFMLGRFFSVPLVWSAALIAASPLMTNRRVATAFASAIVVIGLLAPWEPALLSGYGYTPIDNFLHGRSEAGPRDNGLSITKFEITDTRRYYFEGNGLLKGRLGDRRPDNPGVDDGLALRAGGRQVVTRYAIGFTGFFAGPDVHIIDELALTDPLLARLPAVAGSRVGHYQRDIPAGYPESILDGTNKIVDPDLAEYYDQMRYVVSGPLLDPRRGIAAIGFAIGFYDAPLKRFVHKNWPGRS